MARLASHIIHTKEVIHPFHDIPPAHLYQLPPLLSQLNSTNPPSTATPCLWINPNAKQSITVVCRYFHQVPPYSPQPIVLFLPLPRCHYSLWLASRVRSLDVTIPSQHPSSARTILRNTAYTSVMKWGATPRPHLRRILPATRGNNTRRIRIVRQCSDARIAHTNHCVWENFKRHNDPECATVRRRKRKEMRGPRN